ncbi:MAG: hypothetical protein WCO40_10835 [Thermoleophilia bacterium]
MPRFLSRAIIWLSVGVCAASLVSVASASSPSLFWTASVRNSQIPAPLDWHAAGLVNATDTNTFATSAVATDAGHRPFGLVVAGGFAYWIAIRSWDSSTHHWGFRRDVYRTPVDGSGPITRVPTGGCETPHAISVVDGALFVADAWSRTIARFSVTESLSSNHHPRKTCEGVTLDHAASGLWSDGSFVYWVSTGYGIGRSNVALTDVDTQFIPSTSIGHTALTGIGSTLLWASSANGGQIVSVPSDGSAPPTAIRVPGIGYPHSIAADASYVYWTSSFGRLIGRMDLDGRVIEPAFFAPPVSTTWAQSLALDRTAGHAPGTDKVLKVALDGPGSASGRSASVGNTLINCPGSCSGTYDADSIVNLVMSSRVGSGAHLSALTVTPSAAGSCVLEAATCTVVMSVDVMVKATFSGVGPASGDVPLTIGLGGNGNGSVMGGTSRATTPFTCVATPCVQQIAAPAKVTLYATPETGSKFIGWSGAPPGNTCDSTDPTAAERETCTFVLTDPATVTAVFEPQLAPPLTASITVAPSSLGTVISDPGIISCPGICTTPIVTGQTVTLIARPDPGAVFAGWTGSVTGGAGCLPTSTTCSFAAMDNVTVGATFAAAPTPPTPPAGQVFLDLVKEGSPLGWIVSDPAALACNVNCRVAFAPGADLSLHAQEAPNADFLGWGNSCQGTTLTCRLVMHGNRMVSARFTTAGELRLTRLKYSAAAILVGKRSSYVRALRPLPRHALITYRVSENARVTLTFTRVRPRAVRPHKPRVFTLVFKDGKKGGRPGLSTIVFTGKIAGKAMPKGVWRLTAKAWDGTTTALATIPSKPIYFRIGRRR